MSTQREEFRRWGVMADWARPYLTNSPDYVNTQLDMFLRLYQAGHIFRWGAELLNFNFLRRFHNIHNNVQLLYVTRSYMPVWWSPSSRTALAEAELEYNPAHQSRR